MTACWQRTFRRLVLLLMAACLVLLVAHLSGTARWSRPTVVLITGTLVFLPTFYWWAWVDQRLARARRLRQRPGLRTFLRTAAGGYAVLVFVPVLVMAFSDRRDNALPAPLMMWALVWHLTLGAASVGILAAPATELLGRLTGLRAARRNGATGPADEGPVSTRRAFLRQAGALAPLAIAAGGTGIGLVESGRFVVRRHAIRVCGLPDRLRGLTITHLTDLHIGRLFRPEHLPAMVEAANRLGSDIVAVTGDIINHSRHYLPDACDALGALEHRYGRFVVAGNHDLMDAPREVLAWLAHREPGFLWGRHARVEIGGETLQIAGLRWSRFDEPTFEEPGHRACAAEALAGADPRSCTIALAHHPHAFDALAARGAALVLAGHTHGGQIMLTPQGASRPVGAGTPLFRYLWGEYALGDARLFVSAGVGNWFPVRINAPAEIVQLRLI